MTRRLKIETRLEQLSKTTAWLARKLERNKQSVYQWIEGAEPRDETVWPHVAKLLGIPLEVLLDDSLELPTAPDEVETPRNVPSAVKSFARGDMALLPVWRGVAAGLQDECYFVASDSAEFMEVPAFMAGREEDRHVVCVAAGTSMSPRLRQGDRAVVRLDPNPPRNSLVIAQNPESRRFIKALRENRLLELHSVNEEFPPIVDVSEWQLIGSVVAIWGQYEAGNANIEWDGGRPLRA
jgi:phage repressor protein C with HTH and peptisase S24 domain